MDRLNKYLREGGSVKEGVELVQLFGSPAELASLKYLQSKAFVSQTDKALIVKILRQYYTPEITADESVKTITETVYIKEYVTESVIEKDDPPIILKLRKEFREIRNERRAIHMTLEETAEPQARTMKARRIRQLTKRIDSISEQLDMYDEDGTLPFESILNDSENPILDVVELMIRKKYLSERVCRLNTLLKNSELGQNKIRRYTDELAIKKGELLELDDKIKSLKK